MTPPSDDLLRKLHLPDEVYDLLQAAESVSFPNSESDLIEWALGGPDNDTFEVAYDVPQQGRVVEAKVDRCRNGVAVNYPEPYMRRRDPNCMVIADDFPTDKTRYEERFSLPFEDLQGRIFDWLKQQDLIVMPFYAGEESLGIGCVLIGPKNAAFFAAALGDIQGMVPASEIPDDFPLKAIMYLAPVFRHTHCDGKQVVIHRRLPERHEIYSLNLYPGPSAKKGVYGILLHRGEQEGWITAHCSTVLVITPYDNEFVIMHEGASGGGKSEMLQYPHREPDGRLMIGENIVTGRQRFLPSFQGCTLRPVIDDMALCHPQIQKNDGLLHVMDAEKGWFVRVDHIPRYGVDRYLEELCTNPPEPLVFLNIYSVPRATCLIWEHIEDAPGQPCPNPRVILPRHIVPNIVNGPVEVNVRSFGVRTPPCTRENPTYGILGLLHILPPALAWLWRLVAPRGHANPSITETKGMSSEGVGSYWPFATGRKVDQANLLLRQILATPRTRYILTPNQHVGAWRVGFMPQWLAREYLSRRGSAKFKSHQIEPARCPLLGYALHSMQIEGFFINKEFLQVDSQKEVGTEGYDQGARILTEFFKDVLRPYLDEPDLDPLGRRIIEACLDEADVETYQRLMSTEPVLV